MFDRICDVFKDFGKGQAELGWVANFNYARKCVGDFLFEEGISVDNWHMFTLYERACFEQAFISEYMVTLHKWNGKGEGLYNPPRSESVLINT